MWLLNKLTPDFRTISDFRKDNKKAITKVYKEFNKFCMGLKLFSKSYISIDGSKFKAVNAKDNNLTLNKLDDRIKRLDEHISIYMEELDAYDHEEGASSQKTSCNVNSMFVRSARNVMRAIVILLKRVAKVRFP